MVGVVGQEIHRVIHRDYFIGERPRQRRNESIDVRNSNWVGLRRVNLPQRLSSRAISIGSEIQRAIHIH